MGLIAIAKNLELERQPVNIQHIATIGIAWDVHATLIATSTTPNSISCLYRGPN
jgi:hypothetical protein